jgi:hypothetical protein
LLPIGIIGTMLLLNASVVYFYSQKIWIEHVEDKWVG